MNKPIIPNCCVSSASSNHRMPQIMWSYQLLMLYMKAHKENETNVISLHHSVSYPSSHAISPS